VSVLSVEKIITSGGIALIGGIVFAESGLLIGFFLPGDSLLFTAGFFASQGTLPIVWLLLVVIGAAVIGDNVGYTIGRRMGHRIFKKKDGIIFRQEYIARAEVFYEKHGGKTITIARFVPIVRTFAPMVAGVAKMERSRFMAYNFIGATIWGGGVTLTGYFLGNALSDKIDNIDKYMILIVLLAAVFTLVPPVIHVLKDPVARGRLHEAIAQKAKRFIRFITLNKEV
jgi:membrane-associated protein